MSSISIQPGFAVQTGRRESLVLRLIKKLLLFGVILFGVAFAAFHLRIDKVQIDIPDSIALSTADVAALAGIEYGVGYFSLDTDAIEKRLLECSLIKGAAVKKRFPSTLRIVLEGRTPFAVSFVDSGKCTVPVTIDAEGVVFEVGDSVSDYGRPVISGFSFRDLKLGDRVPEDFAATLAGIADAEKTSADLFARISEVAFEEKRGGGFDIVLYPKSGNIRLLTGAKLDDAALYRAFTALDVVNSIGAKTDAIDCRADKIVYVDKEG